MADVHLSVFLFIRFLFIFIKYESIICKKSKKGKTMANNDDRFIVSVKVGPKGQITIPVEARKMFDIKEGESLLVLGDRKRGGIAIMKADIFYAMMDKEEQK